MMRRAVAILGLACGAIQAAPAALASGTVNLGDVCGPETVLSLVGIDTGAGSALFSVRRGRAEDPAWLLELDAAGREVQLHPDWSRKKRYSGSTGPGPVLALERCGADCRQVVQWSSGDWLPLGSPISVAGTETVHLTWDASGTPWLVLHEASELPGRVRATARRLAAGEAGQPPSERPWEARGALVVRSVGSPALVPDPDDGTAVLTGSGRFLASGDPEGWLHGLPSVPDARRGQVLPLGGPSAFYLAGDGAVYLSDDGGRRWRAMTWTPWTADPAEARVWERGVHYSLDRPVGSPSGRLELVWFDDRLAGDERVVLTVGDVGSWRRVASVPASLDLGAGRRPLEHILRLGPSWLLVSGCASPTEGAGLVVRSVEGEAVSPARLAPFDPVWLGE